MTILKVGTTKTVTAKNVTVSNPKSLMTSTARYCNFTCSFVINPYYPNILRWKCSLSTLTQTNSKNGADNRQTTIEPETIN